MSHAVSDSYLRSVAATWLFTSSASHRLRTTRLARPRPGLLDGATRSVVGELIEWLRPRCRGLSLDALRALAEDALFPQGGDTMSPAALLAGIAGEQLERAGGRVTVRADGRYPQRLEELRWLTLLLPEDLLVAALYAAAGQTDPPSDRLSLVSPPLARSILERPAAETHLHAGAAFSVGTLWTAVVGIHAAEPSLGARLPGDPDCPWGGPSQLAAMLTGAAIARLFMAAFLWATDLHGEQGCFDRWLPPYLDRIALESSAQRPHEMVSLSHLALSTVVGGPQADAPTGRLSMLFRKLAGPRQKPPGSLMALASLDPTSRWLGASHDPWPECRFATRAIRYSLVAKDHAFDEVFWQYQRVRNQLYRFLVQEPGTAGLGWFQRHYDRLEPFRRPLRGLRFESAIVLDSKDVHLGAIEVRTSPPSSSHDVMNDVRSLVHVVRRQHHRGSQPEVGLVFHFLKQAEHGKGRLRRLHGDPRQLVHGCRFGSWAYRTLVEAMAVERALSRKPEILAVLRGFDVASAELAVPTWATLPALWRVRRASEIAADALRRRWPGWPAAPCGTTYHAGEEYTRLVEGIRRVHELLEFGVIRPGDRIGHATSLGEDITRWSSRHRTVVQPREERLDDLLWELDRYGSGDLPADAARVAIVRKEATGHARALYGDAANLDELGEARRKRHDVAHLESLRFPFLRKPAQHAGSVSRHVHAYLADPALYARGRELLRVDVSPAETAMLSAAQRWLKGRLASSGIAIESNPSSNVLIGDFASIDEHPALRLRSIEGSSPAETLLLSVNADDPVTFATCLGDELVHLFGALVRQGVSTTAALSWIGERRDDGFRSRFTIQCEPGVLNELSRRRLCS